MLLATPLTGFVLRALVEGPKRHAELQLEADFPAQTTLRTQLAHLVKIGAVIKNRRDRFPGAIEYELTASGRDLLGVAQILQRWLDQTPRGPMPLGANAAKAAIKALAEGWSTTMLRALAAGPLTLTELDGLIVPLSYPSLERRLVAMRRAGLIAPCPSRGRGTPYTVTDWARQAIAPLAAAANWEQRHLPDASAPIAGLDVEAAFLLTAPLLSTGNRASGSCRLAVELANGQRRRMAGVTVAVQGGEVTSCATDLQKGADAWAIGSASTWLETLIENHGNRLDVGGNRRLALIVIEALREAQFGVPIRKSS
jgi:DNA-binding HxlR family transcriptional regulator